MRPSLILVVIVISVLVAAMLVELVASIRPETRLQSSWGGFFGGRASVPFTMVLLLVIVPIVLALGNSRHWPSTVIDGILTAIFGAYAFASRTFASTGDQEIWRSLARTPDVAMSELLASIAYKTPGWIFGSQEAVGFIAPTFGVGAAASFLWLARRIAVGDRRLLTGLRVILFGSCMPVFFVTGYIENTFLALPSFFSGCALLLIWSKIARRRYLFASSACFAIAVLTHASFFVHATAAVLFVIVVSGRFGLAIKNALLFVSGSVVVAGLVLLAVVSSPLRITPGNSTGGGDNQLLTPVRSGPGVAPDAPLFYSSAHVIQVANILLMCAPVVLPVASVLAILAFRRADRSRLLLSAGADPGLVLVASLSIAYVIFVSLWGFDLGYLGDLDLMLVGGVPLAVFGAVLTARLLRSETVYMSVVWASVLISMLSYGARVLPAWVF